MTSRYQIIGEINQGGVGIVLKAWDTKLQRNVAIKRFLSREQRLALGSVDGDLLREASTLSSMHHPNIVSVYDVDMEGEAGPEVIMEYLNGQDLEQAVAQAALTLEDFYQVAQQTLDALSNAHRMNLLHRDIKPSNIQVTWMANGKFLSKFVDFGLAKFFEKPSKQTVRHDGTVMGSIFYMAPEQFERQPLDRRSDIYSLGCVFYFALTMHRPFEGETVMDVINAHLKGKPVRVRDYRPSVPRDLEKWVEWLMQLQPDNRPNDAEVALSALRQIMAGQVPDGIPGVKIASQPVTTAPAVVDAPVPVQTRPAPTPVPVPAMHRPAVSVSRPRMAPARPATTRTPRRKPQRRAGSLWLQGGVAAALMIGVSLILFRGGQKETGAPAAKPSTAGDILDAAKREAELHKARADLAAAEARLAVSQSSPVRSSLESATVPHDLSQPPGESLVMWFDAARGTRANSSGIAAAMNGPAGQWLDNAANGGRAIMQYTASTTPGKEQNFPTLHTFPATAGLKTSRPVLLFDGAGDTLCVRDKDKTGDRIASTLDGGQTTILMLFRSSGPDAPEGLILARDDKKKTMWSMGVKDNGLICTPGSAPPLVIPGTETEFRIASYTLDALAGRTHLCLVSSSGKREERSANVKLDAAAHLEMLRTGTSDGTTARNRSQFAGDVAEILIYNRALSDESRLHAEGYLRAKYFGYSGPAVMANSK
ncbi:MAG TPA: serine/threonine-protein kinase [Verrucomicrobiales bacterium]|nr:serine/threonine-protein kinase [Verrucomicrobiales bacterium]